VPGKVAACAKQFATLLDGAPAHSWLLVHRPVWALAQGNLGNATVNLTHQAGIRGHVPAGLDMVLSGHLHDFTSYEFGPDRPSWSATATAGMERFTPMTKACLPAAKPAAAPSIAMHRKTTL
jgi:hypothetical protein